MPKLEKIVPKVGFPQFHQLPVYYLDIKLLLQLIFVFLKFQIQEVVLSI